jgi:hypothetical protein
MAHRFFMLWRRGMWMAIPVIVAAAASLPGWPQPAAEAERQLEAGIHREMVLGDLKGAIEQYRAVLGHAGGAKAVEAHALLQMAQCQEKLGRRTEALATYRRVTAEYRATAWAGLAEAKLAEADDNSPGPRNLKFEEGEVGKVPPGWFVPALPREAAYQAQLRRDGCRSAVGCAVVLVPSNAPRPLGYLMQSFNAAPYRGRTVRLRAWLRLEPRPADDLVTSYLRVEAPPAEDRAQMVLSVDRQNHRSGFFDNMDDRPVRSAGWTRCEITGAIDDDARFIEIGVMSIGRGRAWVDDVSFEIVK